MAVEENNDVHMGVGEGRTWFCSNPRCALHVPHELGRHWAELPDGRLFSRAQSINGEYLCDACRVDASRPVSIVVA